MNKGKYCHKYWQLEDANLRYCRDKGQHLKSPGGDTVRVRVPSTAPRKQIPEPGICFLGIIGGLERALRKQSGGLFLARGRVLCAAERSPSGLWGALILWGGDTERAHNHLALQVKA